MLHFKYILLLLPIIIFVQARKLPACKSSVLICYGKLNPVDISNYDYVILEADLYTKKDIELIKKNNKKVLCYISLGEVNQHASYFEDLKGMVETRNHIWNSYDLNLNYKKTRNVLSKVIKNRLLKGFDGLFLDNIDSYTVYGNQYKNSSYLVAYLELLRKKYPSIHIMQNAGLPLLDNTSKYINSLAVESVASNYDFSKKEYRLRRISDFMRQKKAIQRIEKQYQKEIIVIEYANTEALYKEIKSRLKSTNWNCYVAKIDLQKQSIFSKN
ncbi:endo alpha-1,4 polygalactosaminidase [Pseudofulvibacter geojedonensis]|uniref:Endo alpha-1,4 polygalactosaminidase n=1 Tax=Pseudofulvibacter geojedonensis TaxID=1123758 RepID=A0ABW3HYA0_9FLAO